MNERVKTPATSVDAAAWMASLSAGDNAYIAGCALQRIAMELGITEAQLYAEWAERAANDPDCNVIRS